ncbi:MAG TPA: flavodoxin-dependent (E)-4-hydroxy-3-methylbut-2-enyl-diphosphate synthase [Tepidisphaeraceae bacterium]|jgi:(E)-4-hydroxy-3-methylbut-2-enyl-diphosphate synthase|nr:flavodoxin-dependent (E)-4-hydroxy-3-methylbut-2-enyl-diphosphate synthase [Tepidisphaeraceae bacterium]
MIVRRKTRKVMVGDNRVGFVGIGGDAPVSVQSMTAGYTYEIDKCVAEIQKLAAAGADLVRVAVPEKKDTAALKEILPQVTVPIVADVHFHFQRALEAIEAGVHKIRLNPGNINDRAQVKDVIQACKAKKLPIRIGVNEGSIVERKDKQKRLKELGGVFSDNKHGHFLAIMITKLEEYLDIFREEDFHDIVISAKSIDPLLVIDAYAEISKRFDYPLHLGVTHAGPKETGTIRSVVPLGHLLASGVGDTIRISYANDPVYEVQDGLELLYILGLRQRIGAELIACPSCGRIQVDLFKLVQDVRKQLAKEITLPIKVAVMGCVVNGPGECEGADIAIFAGDRKGIIYVQGEKVANVPEDQILETLLKECRNFQAKIERGEAKLGEKKVDILPPDPLGELGSGWEKIQKEKGMSLPVVK